MARIKSKKYQGVYLNHLQDGDISYFINYKNMDNKKIWVKIGKKSNGVNEKFAYTKRAEYINKIKTGTDPLQHKKKKTAITLDSIFQKYKDLKATESKDIIKTEQKYKANVYKVFGDMDINEITTDRALYIVYFQTNLILS